MLKLSPRQMELRRRANDNVVALQNGTRARIEAEQAAARREREREREKELAKQEAEQKASLERQIKKLDAELADWDCCEEDVRRDNPADVAEGMMEEIECQRTRIIEKRVKLEEQLARLSW